MTYLHRLVARVAADLRARDVRFALVGGLAVSVHVEARFTRDVDLALAVSDDDQAERLVDSLQGIGYSVSAMLEQESARRLATVRLSAPGEGSLGANVDFLFASSGIEGEVVAAAMPAELPGGLAIPVARAGHLIVLKLLATDEVLRPQDRVDLTNLLRAVDPAELELARAAARLVEERGYARGRRLVTDLETWIARVRSPAT